MPATVLVVDDDPLNRSILSMSLGREGHEVVEAGTGHEAIVVLEQQPIDLVLTDIEMPEMDGYGLLQHRAADARLRVIPFIVI
ncbi:MAG: response regulator, partial [Acidimicrobiales bacterium]